MRVDLETWVVLKFNSSARNGKENEGKWKRSKGENSESDLVYFDVKT